MPELDRTTKRVAILLCGNVVVGVGVPLLIEWLTDISIGVVQGATIALLLVIVLTTVEALVRVEQVHEMRTEDKALWTQRSEVDMTLGEIRSGLHELIADDTLRDSFYLDHYNRELDLLQSRVKSTIANKEILLDRHHIDSTEVLLSIYDLPQHTVFRATHILSDITDVFDVTYQVYFFAWLERLRNGKVKSLRRLFVYDTPSEFEHPNSKKLVAFHNSSEPGLEAKAIERSEVLRFKADYLISDGVLDFGIFSDQYLYLGQTRRDANISGHFSRNKSQIHTYTSVFDGLWKSTSAVPIEHFVTESITAEQLFDRSYRLDSTEPTPPPSPDRQQGNPV